MNVADRELVVKCALAMGLPIATEKSWARFSKSAHEVWIHEDQEFDGSLYQYNPLINDHQVTQLVKHFTLSVSRGFRSFFDSYARWHVCAPLKSNWVDWSETWNVDYNRAICECVANIKPK